MHDGGGGGGGGGIQTMQTTQLLDSLPFLPQREPSGLDALAEVSRQLQASGDISSEDSLVTSLRQHIEDNHLLPITCQTNVPLAPRTSSASPPGLMQSANSPLVHAASAANKLAEAAVEQVQVDAHVQSSGESIHRKRKASTVVPRGSMPDSHLSYYPQHPPPAIDAPAPDDRLANSTQASRFNDLERDGLAAIEPVSTHEQSPAAASSKLGLGGFGLLQRSNKTKARGRFSEQRRKEVENIRKKGACMRCRMLKKPCSEGTPCDTCKGIENARLWKQTCLRTRLAEEFTLYNTALFYAFDHTRLIRTLNNSSPCDVPGRIEVSLFPDTKVYATFSAMQTSRSDRFADGNLSGSNDVLLLTFKSEDTAALKMERYVNDAIVQCISAEPSTMLRSTLEMAAELSVDYEDTLLTKMIRLWAATNMLVSKELHWTISYNPHDDPVNDHITVVDEKTEEGRAASKCPAGQRRVFAPDSPDHKLLHAQLQDAAERYCIKQSRTCMGELERRLLQRHQTPTFLTFFAAVILLNCVERMTALYRSFDPVADETSARRFAENQRDTEGVQRTPSNASTESTQAINEEINVLNVGQDNPDKAGTDREGTWPLKPTPSELWPQGYSFSQLLQMLIRMRSFEPNVTVRNDGSLAIVALSKTYPVDTPCGNTNSESHQLAMQWFNRIGLRSEELWRKRDLSDQEAGRAEDKIRSWDMRFIAPLLLPLAN